MKPKHREILARCIDDGTVVGIGQAYKHRDEPNDTNLVRDLVREIYSAIWLEIDTYFTFDDEGPGDP